MATTKEYIEYVCEQISELKDISYKKMFGEYMVYKSGKPVLIVCNNTVYVKKIDSIRDIMIDAKLGFPYHGAKEHYILDIENSDFSKKIVREVEKVTPLPKSRKK